MRNFAAVAALLAFSVSGFGFDKKVIAPKGSSPAGPYSPGILVDGTLYAAGQVGRDAKGDVPADFEAEVRQCLDNVGLILREADMTFADVVSVQVYLTDMDLFQRMNAVYMKVFPEPRPARTTVGIAKLVGTARIEVTVTARRSGLRVIPASEGHKP